jgi:hypothetical protein
MTSHVVLNQQFIFCTKILVANVLLKNGSNGYTGKDLVIVKKKDGSDGYIG